jgi:eukaryotic-like serine/threonine-protein kinase
MPAERWERLQELFEEALARAPDSRPAFLQGACPDDPELRAEVETLLRHARDTGPLRGAFKEALAEAAPLLAGPQLGDRVGPYRLEAEVGHGGMGAVYLAVRDDQEYEKRVAVKLLRGGIWSADLLARFRAERQILARLEHPNIARLLDGGTGAQGQPYLVMELVEGRPITEYCETRALPVSERVRLFATVCDAVQYAHQNLVVHRDLKPSNILVTDDGTAKLLDFGIAKLLDPTALTPAETRTHMRLMTPDYASPEQARGDPVTTASDVYSLGVVLYELLSGRRPLRFEGDSPSRIERRLREEQPPRPSTAAGAGGRPGPPLKQLAGDLDTIVLKALQKEPVRRYASAQALAEDLRRCLTGRPVLARPDSVRYRTGKFVRRHRAGVAAAAGVALLLVGFAVTMAVQAARLARERNKALAAEQEARQVAGFVTGIFQVPNPSVARGNTVTAREVLDTGAARIRSQLRDQPLVKAALLQTIGNTYRGLGLFREAQPLLDESLALRRWRLGEDHADTASSLNDAAEVRRQLSDYAGAEPLHRHALEVRTRLLGPGHAQVGESLNNLALTLQEKGQLAEAEDLYRRALEVRRGALGERHEDVTVTLSNLGQVVKARGDLAQAERLNRETLALRRAILGPDHPLVLNSMHVLASTLANRGRDGEAQAIFREVLALRLRVLGPDHVDTTTTMNNLASLLQDQGRLEEAEALYRRGLEARRRTLPADHLDIAVSLNNLASLLEGRDELAEAERLYGESLVIRLKRLGDASPVTARGRNNLGRVLAARGNFQEGEALLRVALETRLKSLGPKHPDVAESRASLALALAERGRAREAEPLARDALEALGPDTPENSPLRARARIALGASLCAGGRPAEGLPLLRQGRDALAARVGPANRMVRVADRWLRRFERSAADGRG